MNKKTAFLAVLAGLLLFTLPVSAQIVNPLPGVNSFAALFDRIISTVSAVVASAGIIMLVLAGIFYMTSAGSTERIGIAKKTLTYAIIGIAIGILEGTARAITDLIKTTTGGGTGDIFAILRNIEGQILTVVGPICAVMVIIAGIFYLTSAGSPERTKIARSAFIYVIVGTVIALGATLIYSFIYSVIVS